MRWVFRLHAVLIAVSLMSTVAIAGGEHSTELAKAKKPSKAKEINPPPVKKCKAGMIETNGYCCWIGQEWNVEKKTCIGEPVCPWDHIKVGNSCKKNPCRDGLVLSEGHCCWPGTSWDEKTKACVGSPDCPGQFVQDGVNCIPFSNQEMTARVGKLNPEQKAKFQICLRTCVAKHDKERRTMNYHMRNCTAQCLKKAEM